MLERRESGGPIGLRVWREVCRRGTCPPYPDPRARTSPDPHRDYLPDRRSPSGRPQALRTCVPSPESHWKPSPSSVHRNTHTLLLITRGFSSAATFASPPASQDTVPPSPPSRVRTDNRTHSQTGTPSRSLSACGTARTLRTGPRQRAGREDAAPAGVAEAPRAPAAILQGPVPASWESTTIPRI